MSSHAAPVGWRARMRPVHSASLGDCPSRFSAWRRLRSAAHEPIRRLHNAHHLAFSFQGSSRAGGIPGHLPCCWQRSLAIFLLPPQVMLEPNSGFVADERDDWEEGDLLPADAIEASLSRPAHGFVPRHRSARNRVLLSRRTHRPTERPYPFCTPQDAPTSHGVGGGTRKADASHP